MGPKRILSALLMLALLGSMLLTSAAAENVHPLVSPQTVEYIETPDEIYNVLLLGIERGFDNYHQSDWTNKPTLRECHTDVLMVMSFNKTRRVINLVSIPRDTLAYVPGVHGIYKINAAFNLADTNEAGFEKVKETVSWLLGGVRIDAYCAVDMKGLVTLGDALGGVDFFVDMTYTGSSNTRYFGGNQHLNGMDIMDYCRARTNATVDNDDLGRNRRCRAMIATIIEKLRDDQALVLSLWELSQSGEIAFFTDVTLDDVLTMWTAIQTYSGTVGSYGIVGYYGDGELGWFFNHTYQAERVELIKNVFGVSVPQMPYITIRYTKWMMESGGFLTVRNLRQTQAIIAYAKENESPTSAMQSALANLEAAYATTASAFSRASETLEEMDRLRMMYARKDMEAQAERVASLFRYPGSYSWTKPNNWEWDLDPLINDYYNLNWR